MESAACHDGSRVSYLSAILQPTLDFIKYKIVNLFLRNSGLFRNLVRVVPALDDAELGRRRQVPDNRCQFGCRKHLANPGQTALVHGCQVNVSSEAYPADLADAEDIRGTPGPRCHRHWRPQPATRCVPPLTCHRSPAFGDRRAGKDLRCETPRSPSASTLPACRSGPERVWFLRCTRS